ncbi:tripartite tricarboxylate transporter TctB family protein [Teichococcus aestuarii]|uniref:DUF1468 domain-containing protein n=2 Tax=Teichococcus aestuarii TaxID=568898 RepID=A0A2U1V3N1_9PROT|nr:tripartite tricarboxylate transporter TctB family protein [Pseudoroseomonas aestuarii]PWC28520.1 hypothetical protein CR165_12570 [Pseudoroseomonas aestuarii]
MRLNDRALGVLTLGLGGLLLAASLRLPGVPGQELGAGFFPALLGGGVMAAGTGLLLAAGRQPGEPWLRAPAWMRDRWAATNVALLVASIVLFALLAETVGFIPLAIAILLAVQLRLGIAPVRAAVTAVLGAIGFHLLFVMVLRVPLPPGLLEGWL